MARATSVRTTTLGFSGHEGFALRSLWLNKAVDAVNTDSGFFSRDDATVGLGVGKNMVHSIRHWGIATGSLIATNRGRELAATDLGANLFAQSGWDPYFEDPATAWVVHWQLVANPHRAATWHLCFTEWPRDLFTHEQLVRWIGSRNLERDSPSRTTENSLKRDVEVLTRTYIRANPNRELPIEDAYDSPLSELALLEEVDRGTFRIVRGPKPTLPDEVLWHAIDEFWRSMELGSSASFDRLLNSSGSPGAAFALGDRDLTERLERIPEWTGFRYDDTSGNRILFRSEAATTRPLRDLSALRRYFDPNNQYSSVLTRPQIGAL